MLKIKLVHNITYNLIETPISINQMSDDQLSTSLSSLSKVAGVDLNGLRDKYKNIQRETERTKNTISTENLNDLRRLDNYRICKSCLGKGTTKTLYNHMVLERDCEECDGESIVLSQERIASIAKGLS